MGRALVLYQDESRNSPFNHDKTWAILRQHTKWDAPEVAPVDLTEDETSDFHATVNTDELFGVDPRPRPPGKQRPGKKPNQTHRRAPGEVNRPNSDLKDIYAYSAGSSVHAKEVDNDSKELKDKIEALNEELVIERQTRGAAEANLEHLHAEYTEADAKSHELEAKLAEEQQVKERDEKDFELDSKLNRLHKRAKQQIQEVQKEKDDIEAKYKEVNEKSEQATSRLSGLQQKLDRTRQHANEALKAIDTERQQL
nr:protein GRIP [Tanacetum cinerariifolium]